MIITSKEYCVCRKFPLFSQAEYITFFFRGLSHILTNKYCSGDLERLILRLVGLLEETVPPV